MRDSAPERMAGFRRANFDDVSRLSTLVAELIAASGIPQKVDRAYTQGSLARLLCRPADAVVLISPHGFFAGSIERTMINPEPIAVEHGWYAPDGQGLRMLRYFEVWAARRGARVRLSTGAAGPDLARLGYVAVERAWVRK